MCRLAEKIITTLLKASLKLVHERYDKQLLEILLATSYPQVKAYYNKSEKIKELKEAAPLGIPGAATKYSALLGISPLDSYSFNILEHKILKIQDNWIPLSTSYTQSGSSDTGGAPTKDDDELTDEGAKSRDKESGAENNGD